jgi:hypothetical protein
VTAASAANQNRELIRQAYELANAGELGQIASFYAEDYRLTQSPGHPVPGSWVGREATEAGIRVFNVCGTNRVTIREIIADGPHRVIGIVDAHGTTPGGRDWAMPVSEHFWIEDGKITDIRPFYWIPLDYAGSSKWRSPGPGYPARGTERPSGIWPWRRSSKCGSGACRGAGTRIPIPMMSREGVNGRGRIRLPPPREPTR